MPNAPVHVGCDLTFRLAAPTKLVLHVAVAETAEILEERFLLDGDAEAGDPVTVATEVGGRLQVVDAGPGLLQVSYRATVGGPVAPPRPTDELARLVALRQSRYCPSDQLAGFAGATFGEDPDAAAQASRVASWVFERLSYEPGSSRSTDSAVDTLGRGEGVCRDFAHLTITLCRALGIPARLAAVYAPGLSPMDFHAVSEIWDGEGWQVLDATRLAPRPSLVRIATGRDAADTAFATIAHGEAEFLASSVFAVIDGELPADDHEHRVTLD